MENCDILIIGGGAAGIAAAKRAAADGAAVMLVEHEATLGGVLRQCAHHGFGKGLSGPEYVASLLQDFPAAVQMQTGTTALAVSPERQALLASSARGRWYVAFDQLILATGCYEKPIGALGIAGTRPSGVYTAGAVQALMNLHGWVPPGPVVILGSGDLGLIMAAQCVAHHLPVTIVEQRAFCSGLARNQHILSDARLRLICGTTIAEIHGTPVLTEVLLENGETLSCQTLLVACGLCPERTLVESLGVQRWLHLCGNCRGVQKMIETVVQDGIQAGAAASRQWLERLERSEDR